MVENTPKTKFNIQPILNQKLLYKNSKKILNRKFIKIRKCLFQ